MEEWLPLEELNIDAVIEVGFKGARMPVRAVYEKTFGIPPMVVGPRLRNVQTWWARRPAGTARVLTLASAMPCEPEGEVRDLLVRTVNLNKDWKSIHNYLIELLEAA